MSSPTVAALAPPAPAALPPLWKTYLALLLPMMLTNVLQAVAGTLDGIYLGQMIGPQALAAAAVFFPVVVCLLSVVIGLASGATVLAGQAWGAKDVEATRAVAGAALWPLMLMAMVVALSSPWSASVIVEALGTPTEVRPDAVRYAQIMLAGMPLLFLLWFATSLSRAVGDALTPLGALGVTTVVAMLCTPAFIRGWFGLPQLGVASAAVSTLLGVAVAGAWLAWIWRRRGHPFAPTRAMLAHLRWQPARLRQVLWLGSPVGLQMLAFAGAELVLLRLVNQHGAAATAAYGTLTQVMSWLQFPAMSLGIVATILGAHAIGAGRAERLPAITRTGLQLNLAVTGGIMLGVYAVAPALLALFLTDPAVHAMALGLLHLVAWTTVLRGASMVLVGVMRASGTVWMPTALGVVVVLALELPLAVVLSVSVGLRGIWWAYVVTFVAMFGVQAAYYLLAWRHGRVARLA